MSERENGHLGFISLDKAPENLFAKHEQWRPEYWEALGFQRNWGDAGVMDPYFEVLRKPVGVPVRMGAEYVEFVVLCPTFLRRPLILWAKDDRVWGGI